MANVYNTGAQLAGDFDLGAAGTDLRMLLLQSSGPPTFDRDHATVAAVLGHANNTELTATGYARTALPTAGRTTSVDQVNDRADFDNTKVTFAAIDTGQTIGAAVIYEEGGGTDATRIPVAFYDPADQATDGNTVEMRFNSVDGVGTWLRATTT